MKNFDGAMANEIRNQLKGEGTFTKTGVEEVDTFLEFVRKDIQFIKSYLEDCYNSYIADLAELAYGFVLMTVSSAEGAFRTHRVVELRELAKLETFIYRNSSSRNTDVSFVPVIKPADFVRRLEMLGMKEGAVLMNPSLKSAYDLLSSIYLDTYPEVEWQMADIIYWSQEYAYAVFKCIDLVGGEAMIEEAEARFMSELTRIQRRIISFYSKKNDDRSMTMKGL